MQGYAKIKSFEITNFMAIKHAVCEFDEKGIIFLKGYNDSGKSAVQRALNVVFYNKYARSQVQFIKDGEDYFRIVVKFEDGVVILRDKYINGQSLYEMYKDGECIFSTKVNGVLTTVSDVPDPIKTYLGLIEELCSRSCYDKQFAVETTGSENYKAFSSILKAEEMARAGELINSDKNRVGQDIVGIESRIDAYKSMIPVVPKTSEELLSHLEMHDKRIDFLEALEKYLGDALSIKKSITSLKIAPPVEQIDCSRMDTLLGIKSTSDSTRSIKVSPELGMVDESRLDALAGLSAVRDSLGGIVLYPEVKEIDGGILKDAQSLSILSKTDVKVPPRTEEIDIEGIDMLNNMIKLIKSLPDIDTYDTQISDLKGKIKENVSLLGDNVVVCDECGHVMNI